MEAADRRKAQDTHLNVCQVQVTNPSITKDEMMAGMAAGMGANLPIFTEPRAGLNSWPLQSVPGNGICAPEVKAQLLDRFSFQHVIANAKSW